jgi:hypothetical protein
MRKVMVYLAMLAFIVIGFYLIGTTVMLAARGENKALWLLVSFAGVVTILAWFLKRFWVLALDDRDVLDIFKIASISNESSLAHFQREYFQHSKIVTERGYSYTVRDGQTEIRTSLVYLGKEYADRKTIIGEQALLTIAVRVGQPFNMAIMNPQADIRESLDVNSMRRRFSIQKNIRIKNTGSFFPIMTKMPSKRYLRTRSCRRS